MFLTVPDLPFGGELDPTALTHFPLNGGAVDRLLVSGGLLLALWSGNKGTKRPALWFHYVGTAGLGREGGGSQQGAWCSGTLRHWGCAQG